MSLELFSTMRVVALPTNTNFRGINLREVALFKGEYGWAEFSPFLEYGYEESAPWLMCAIEAGKRGRRVLMVDHGEVIGRKILISGGGRCNFTNLGAKAERYISHNPHFCKSALAQFTVADFVALVEKHRIAYHEKKLGQQFCDESAQHIVDMLLDECAEVGVNIQLNCTVDEVQKTAAGYALKSTLGPLNCASLVVATGGLSIPKMGATNFGYKLAQQFGVPVIETTPALVPFTFTEKDLAFYEDLSGISFDAVVRCGKVSFRENVLMTHRGVSGPAILQISSYWRPGEAIHIQMLPEVNWSEYLKAARKNSPKQDLKTVLAEVLAKRLVQRFAEKGLLPNKDMAQLADSEIHAVSALLSDFVIKPNGTEGYRKAEVTAGGIDTNALHAATMECRAVKGLFFIGEVVDVTGWLGGYNFQWAWASGAVAGRNV
jgi:predicted Rossmann fold flavoprotein